MFRRGFTLIEVLGAIVLLSVAIVPVMALIRNTLIITQKQEWNLRCLYLAKQKMEETMELLRDDFSASITTSGNLGGNYEYTVALTQNGGISTDALKIITGTVWYDEDGDESIDSGEVNVVLSDKLANLGDY